MIVKLFDHTELVVSQAEATSLAQAIQRGVSMVTLRGCLINTKAVAAVLPGGHTEADVSDRRLAAPDHRGQYSPAKEALRAKFSKA